MKYHTNLINCISGICCLVVLLCPNACWSQDWTQSEVDQAIANSLDYLSRRQTSEGSWTIDSLGESTAATSLAVMSFLAAGHVPGEGPYGSHINRGIRWVLDHQEGNGMLVHKKSHGPMYSHGISTLMLSEAIGMVRAEDANDCRRALERAVRLILQSQAVSKTARHQGGWRYQPNSRDSDLSVTGWLLLSLRAAKDIGCDVPAESIDLAVDYVKNCSTKNRQGFGYQPGNGPTPTRTGIGILSLEICGVHHSREALGGAEYLKREPLKVNDYYFYYGTYYCTVGMFKMGGDHWTRTRDHLFPILLKLQGDDGSWKSDHPSERRQGKVYATSMAVLALAVDYRYLPIYQR